MPKNKVFGQAEGGQIQFNKIGNCEKGEKYAYNIKLRKLMDWNRHDTI